MTAGDRRATYTNIFTDRTLTFKVTTQFTHGGRYWLSTTGDPSEIEIAHLYCIAVPLG